MPLSCSSSHPRLIAMCLAMIGNYEVWVLTCKNATYRIGRYPDMSANVQKLKYDLLAGIDPVARTMRSGSKRGADKGAAAYFCARRASCTKASRWELKLSDVRSILAHMMGQ